MSVVRSEVRQAEGELMLADGAADSLAAALDEIAKVAHALGDAGDAATLERFGDLQSGAELASTLGHDGVADEDARVVDRLSWMPDGLKLVRAYLAGIRSGD